MTRSTTGSASEEFRDVARDAMKLGSRCVGATRDWLGEKREEFNLGRAAGAGVSVHGYRGIGPRGYRRDDARIHDDVCDALTDDDALDAGDITVSVQDGVVKLSGTVPHRLMKRLAEDLSEACAGVRDVENALRMGTPGHAATPQAAASQPGATAQPGASQSGPTAPGPGPSSGPSSGPATDTP